MPICPRCSASIHAGANDQCPACGYSLLRANEKFGNGEVEFTRVRDAAGALTHQERLELLHFLENLERDIPPVALGIYITDVGLAEEFRTQAHWILNHARIHHPSFGRREQRKAIEDAELNLRFTRGDAAAEDAPPPPVPVRQGFLSRIRSYLRDALHPHLPPPVRKQWMLILVLDVQLERACFSWGYQLDPYIDPDSINRCIVGAKFQFRERAMVAGLRRVMRAAVREIASRSRRVNAQLRRTGRAKVLLAALAFSLSLALCPCEAASPQDASPQDVPAQPPLAVGVTLLQDDVAEELSPEEEEAAASAARPADELAEEPAPGASAAVVSAAVPAPELGAPATFTAPPRWEEGDYRHLMAGELVSAYSLLLPPADTPQASPRFGTSLSAQQLESDKKVLGRYCEAYRQASPAGLCDPQGLLTVEERRDVEHVLRELNANGRFRVYAALYRAGQQLPPELAAHTLTTATAKPCEYAVLLLFPLGDSQLLDLGYQEINPADEDRHAWLQRVRSAAAPEGDGLDALLLAIREIHAVISPLAPGFRVLSTEVNPALPHIAVELRPDTGEKKVPVKDKIAAFYKDEANHSLLVAGAVLLVLFSGGLLFIFFRPRSGHLLESVPDVRLSSPYGAGVSRYVRYLEGKESPKESRIF